MELRDYWRIVGRYFDGYVERAFGDISVFMEYARRVRAITTTFLETWDPADFDVPIVLKPLGTMTKLEAMGQQALPHGFAHLGEVAHIRALQGLPGTGI